MIRFSAHVLRVLRLALIVALASGLALQALPAAARSGPSGGAHDAHMLAMTQSDHDMSQIVTGDAGSMMQLCKQHCMSVPAVAPPQPDAIMLHSVAISVLRAPVALPHGLTCAPFDRPPKLLV